MTDIIYTAITFAPVQGFIEKSRKLRDLYGSSYLLSYMARSICLAAEQSSGCSVVSPAMANVTQGMPNQIIVRGTFADAQEQSEEIVKRYVDEAWQLVVNTCQTWIEEQLRTQAQSNLANQGWRFVWNRNWQLWGNHAWEFFLAQGHPGESITEVRQRLNERKRSRNWTGVNWQGESSTLSGADAVAFPGMGREVNPKRGYLQQKDIQQYFDQLTDVLNHEGIIEVLYQNGLLGSDRRIQTEQHEIRAFYKHLSRRLGETFARKFGLPLNKRDEYGEPFIDPREELSIPELTKRLITHRTVVDALVSAFENQRRHLTNQQLIIAIQELAAEVDQDLNVQSFRELNRLPQKNGSQQPVYWTGWFMGDGDGASDYLKQLGKQAEETGTEAFSQLMREWGQEFKANQQSHLPASRGRIIYAGGDDFLGVLYEAGSQMPPQDCLNWFSTFKSHIWHGIDNKTKPISVSVGFVWAAPKIPQREVLQHCRDAEKSAKNNGKDRIALRVLFNSGNYLEWLCPWWLLEAGLLEDYCDRNKKTGADANWTHIYNDVAVLESRHAFEGNQIDVAWGLFEVYFPSFAPQLRPVDQWWNRETSDRVSGILGERKNYQDQGVLDIPKVHRALNDWIINLAKVRFHLCSNT